MDHEVNILLDRVAEVCGLVSLFSRSHTYLSCIPSLTLASLDRHLCSYPEIRLVHISVFTPMSTQTHAHPLTVPRTSVFNFMTVICRVDYISILATQTTFAYMAGADMQTKRTMMKMNNAQRDERLHHS